MKIQELRNLSLEEVADKVEELRKQFMELSFQKKTSHVEKPHLFKQIKKRIARAVMVLREKQNGKS
ncbi:MAG: 50S ribosomal protein L29 [Candidatus Omnitrophica bacterium]|nr:50S ribosomal protein L29 [Candidatus Omnitrophota bacterium]